MQIERLVVNDFRNLEYVDIKPCPRFNFICGPNGSGKTSVLEAIHYLALARSFRTNDYKYLIRQGSNQFNLFSSILEHEGAPHTTIGLSRSRGESPIIKINSDPLKRVVDLVDHLCVQIIHPQGVELITKESEGRRNFIDWGVYYSKPQFKVLWLKYRKALKHRNALLRAEALKLRRNSRFQSNRAPARSFLNDPFNSYPSIESSYESHCPSASNHADIIGGMDAGSIGDVGAGSIGGVDAGSASGVSGGIEGHEGVNELERAASCAERQDEYSVREDKLSYDAKQNSSQRGSIDLYAGELDIWDQSLAELSEQITALRLEYLDELQLVLQDLIGKFLPNFKLKFELNYGWEKGHNLRDVMAQNLEKERSLGYTLQGCHRADLKIKNNHISAGATLSRGQLKMLVYAMRLAQGMLLREQTQRPCIYLIDDLNSELDEKSQGVLFDTLIQCQHQVFISNIRNDISNLGADAFMPKDRSDHQIFCLEKGMVINHMP